MLSDAGVADHRVAGINAGLQTPHRFRITLTIWKKGVSFDPKHLHRQAA